MDSREELCRWDLKGLLYFQQGLSRLGFRSWLKFVRSALNPLFLPVVSPTLAVWHPSSPHQVMGSISILLKYGLPYDSLGQIEYGRSNDVPAPSLVLRRLACLPDATQISWLAEMVKDSSPRCLHHSVGCQTQKKSHLADLQVVPDCVSHPNWAHLNFQSIELWVKYVVVAFRSLSLGLFCWTALMDSHFPVVCPWENPSSCLSFSLLTLQNQLGLEDP